MRNGGRGKREVERERKSEREMCNGGRGNRERGGTAEGEERNVEINKEGVMWTVSYDSLVPFTGFTQLQSGSLEGLYSVPQKVQMWQRESCKPRTRLPPGAPITWLAGPQPPRPVAEGGTERSQSQSQIL